MTRDEKLAELRSFVASEFLDGRDAGLDEDTPLLEWGVIDSISVAKLVSFSRDRFGVEVPQSEIVPANVQSLGAFVALLERLPAGADAN